LSADSWVYLEIQDPARLLERYQSKPVQRLLHMLPGYQKALESPQLKQLEAVVDFLSNDLKTTRDEAIRDLTGGGVVFAMEPGAEGNEKPAFLLVLQPRDAAFLRKAHDRLVELARQDAKGKGNPDPVSTFPVGGATGYSLSPEEAHAILDDRLVVANDRKALERFAGRPKAGSGAGAGLHGNEIWSRERAGAKSPDTLAFAYAKLDPLRKIQAATAKEKPKPSDPNVVLLLGTWIRAIEKSPWGVMRLEWTGDEDVTAGLTLGAPEGGFSPAVRRFVPPSGEGASAPIQVPGQIASFSIWRDWGSVWDARAELLTPESVQNLAQLDTQAGTFFGGRDFGTGVLGALGAHWRFVIAHQSYESMTPAPDLKLPGFAVVIEMKPEDVEFHTRMKAAFQSFIGLFNLGAAQQKAPPLLLSAEMVDGLSIATAKYATFAPSDSSEKSTTNAKPAASAADVYNYTPSAFQVGNHFVISSSLDLARELAKTFKAGTSPGANTTASGSDGKNATLLAVADGSAVARLVALNKDRLVMQNMLEKGNDKASAEAEIGYLEALVQWLGQARMSISDSQESVRVLFRTTLGK
jgi:hypothetical protein